MADYLEVEHEVSELKKAIASAEATDIDVRLRLFACWCARITQPERARWLGLISASEAFALGAGSQEQLKAARSALSNAAGAASAIGMKIEAPNAASMLACMATARDDTRGAAESVVWLCVMWARFTARRHRIPESEAELELVRNLTKRLREILASPSIAEIAANNCAVWLPPGASFPEETVN